MDSDTAKMTYDMLVPLMKTKNPPLTSAEFTEFRQMPHKFPALLAALQNMQRAYRGRAETVYAAAAADRVAREKKA